VLNGPAPDGTLIKAEEDDNQIEDSDLETKRKEIELSLEPKLENTKWIL
jgi:hypothetical protein